jgi:sulfur-carrier protein
MNIKLTCGAERLISGWPGDIPPTVEQLLYSVRYTHPQRMAGWCDETGQLRTSLTVFVNGQHTRYRQGLQTELQEGDEVYVIPLIAGG